MKNYTSETASVLPFIRLAIDVILAITMIVTLVLAWCYPIMQELHQTILLQLKEQYSHVKISGERQSQGKGATVCKISP